MADVVFIIGAGCSVHAGGSVMANFLDRARTLYAAGKVNDRKKEFATVFEALSLLQRVHSKSKLDLFNIESVFSALDVARTLRKLPGFKPEEIDNVLSAFQWVIVRTLEESVAFTTQGGVLSGTRDYRELAKLVLSLGRRQPALSAAIITFNYDLALDLSLDFEGVPFTYGFEDSADGFCLLKLHGSLNWVRMKDKSRKVVPLLTKDYRSKFRRMWFKEKDDGPPCYVQITRQFAEIAPGLEVEELPVLAPPTWGKGEHHREIGQVWARAAQELEGAKFVCVMGYSLPATDQFFRLLFALGSEGNTLIDKFIVIDPDHANVEARFRGMLGEATLARYVGASVELMSGLPFLRSVLQAPPDR